MNAREYSDRLSDLLRSERHAMADFLVALADFDERRLWLDLGYASLFAFLQRQLRLSNGAAAVRKTAAERIQAFPDVVEPLRDGRLCLSTVFEVSKVITKENAADVLPRFFGTSKLDAKAIVAELKPEPAPVRTVVTTVRASAPRQADLGQVGSRPADLLDANFAAPPQEVRSLPPSPPPRTVVEPKNATLTRLSVTVSRAFPKKLAEAREALSHTLPGAADGEILEAALDLVLAQAAKRRHLVKNPRKVPPPRAPDSDAIPADVAREVWLRDGGRCQFPTADGGVCGSTYQCELDHIEPKALGGQATKETLRVACKPHNLGYAREVYGDQVMDCYCSNPRDPRVREPEVAYGTSLASFDPASRNRSIF